MNDPYLSEDNCFKRLWDDYIKHGGLVVAVDNDGTIFDLHGKGFQFPAVIGLLRECHELGFKIVIYSAAAANRHEEITNNCIKNNIPFDAINSNVIEFNDNLDRSRSKLYYNVFLCDRAGLPSAYRVLRRVVDKIKHDKKVESGMESVAKLVNEAIEQ